MSTDPVLRFEHRLQAIAESVSRRPRALALIGLGSAGLEHTRMDRWSDLDFFLVVSDGAKRHFVEEIDWLSEVAPVAWSFRNTPDGHKLLYEDGIFCELAVFEMAELDHIPFAEGRLVWSRVGVPPELAKPRLPVPVIPGRSTDWCLGEALSNLLVGLARDARGERLSALRFIQGYAVDRVLELMEMNPPHPAGRDPFAPERRFEQRHPASADLLASWMQGYNRNRESARAILDWLEARYPVPVRLAGILRESCDPGFAGPVERGAPTTL